VAAGPFAGDHPVSVHIIYHPKQKTMKTNINDNLHILSREESIEIHGGETAWYWIAYGIGSIGRGFAAYWKYCEEHPLEAESWPIN
jgi:hypothetical protein